jgi:hypothetical protein
MRIQGSTSPAVAGAAPTARRVGAGGFSVTDAGQARPQTSAGALRNVGGIDALIALQAADDSSERRRARARRGKLALDLLDELKLALLSGSVEPAMLNRLKAAAAELDRSADDPGLDAVLGEIDLRLAVEIAKLSRR